MPEDFIVTHKDIYRILLVDDDDNFRKAHKRLLNLVHFSRLNAYFEVVDSGSADDAINKLRESPFDCVLLDYVMPGRDGLTCLKEMHYMSPDMPIILLTGAGNEQVAVDALKEGAMDYLIKGTLSLEMLERSIVNVITKAAMLKQLEDQRKQLLEVERHRVMIQTLGAACHHLSQPVTVLRTCMVMIKRKDDLSSETHEVIMKAYNAIETVCDILWKMNHVSKFTTEPYLEAFASGENNEILKLE